MKLHITAPILMESPWFNYVPASVLTLQSTNPLAPPTGHVAGHFDNYYNAAGAWGVRGVFQPNCWNT